MVYSGRQGDGSIVLTRWTGEPSPCPHGEPQGTRLNPAGDQTIIYQWKAETERIYNPFGFCGEYVDGESGLIYLRARMYDPSTGRFINEDPIRDGLNWYVYCENNPIMFVDPWGLKKDGDNRLTQEERDAIEIYSTIWFDAQIAFENNIIEEHEKNSVQSFAERKADDIRYAHDHPILTLGNNVLEFALFDVALGDISTVVYAADYTNDGLEKIYANANNLSKVVSAGIIKGFTGGNSRTIGKTKVKGQNVRIDIEMPTGKSIGNVHLHIDNEKIFLNSIDDIDDLAKGIRKSDKVVGWIKKAFKLINKIK